MSPTCTSILTSTASPTRTLGQQTWGMENMWTSSLPPTRGVPQLILQEVLYLYFWNLRLNGLHYRAGCQFRCFWSASHWLLMIPHCLLEMRPSSFLQHYCACAQSCLTLYNPMDCSPRSSVPGILQARILEWVASSSSRGSSQPRDWTLISCVSCIAGRFFTHWAIREANVVFQ